MKRRLIASLAVTVMLVATMAVPAMAAPVEQPFGASVEVNEYINFTVMDWTPGTGLQFGGVDPGTDNVSELAQTGGHGAVTLKVHADTNVSCNVTLKGDDFSGPGPSIPISNAKWDGVDNNVIGSTLMTLLDADITQSVAGVEKIQQVWHWLSIPGNQTAGSYVSVFTYRAAKIVP